MSIFSFQIGKGGKASTFDKNFGRKIWKLFSRSTFFIFYETSKL